MGDLTALHSSSRTAKQKHYQKFLAPMGIEDAANRSSSSSEVEHKWEEADSLAVDEGLGAGVTDAVEE